MRGRAKLASLIAVALAANFILHFNVFAQEAAKGCMVSGGNNKNVTQICTFNIGTTPRVIMFDKDIQVKKQSDGFYIHKIKFRLSPEDNIHIYACGKTLKGIMAMPLESVMSMRGLTYINKQGCLFQELQSVAGLWYFGIETEGPNDEFTAQIFPE